ncbi:hypothetical protein SUDANB121_03833 [Nocardiopsis dassonvillei]|uniref:DUF6507 family protein n=1 Tax=Nocardiopsis dassonvillei TaxID=2014 RepID=UPI003F578368
MSTWDIDPPGVGGVLTEVFTTLGDGSGDALDGTMNTMAEEILAAATASCSAPVQNELYNFLEHYSGLAEAMVTRAGSAMEGCSLAVDAYLAGDLEMAEEAQNNAGVVDSVDPMHAPH